ncbi:hypothetical protein F5Y06DRAFT_67039 [Hypoxylon sp. FL0890]|nr:hypothetical protein F5Y06DRAFT_67039 [Hypoxylon sp. FL0890]
MNSDSEKVSSSSSSYLGYPFKIEGSEGWAGNQPCVHGPTAGCYRHNPKGLPIAWNERIPSDKKRPGFFDRLFSNIDRLEYDEIQQSTRIWSSLHLDHSTADPLDPIHKSIHYSLAYYHLDWVRKAGSPESQRARANAIACNGVVVGDAKKCLPDFHFSITPYWYNDSFLVRQVIRFTIEPKKRNPVFGRESVYLGWPKKDWVFWPCPHVQHRFQEYQFTETRGLMKASMSFNTKKRNCLGDWFRDHTEWHSIYGPDCTAWNCRYCCTDNRVNINMVEDKIVVNIFTYKDLGSAKNAHELKWLSALRPKGPRYKRSRAELDMNTVRTVVLAAFEAEKETQSSRTK